MKAEMTYLSLGEVLAKETVIAGFDLIPETPEEKTHLAQFADILNQGYPKITAQLKLSGQVNRGDLLRFIVIVE